MNATYRYNAQGQRVKKVVDVLGQKGTLTTTTLYHYDQGGQLIAETDGQGNLLKEYLYLDGQRLATVDNSAIYYIHTDHLGSPLALTDNNGTVQWKGSYDPYGNVTVEVSNLDQNQRFPGQYADEETGLHYNYFRDYDPEIGRYIQSDPIGLNGGINTYGYVGGNPTNAIDIYGLDLILVGQGGSSGGMFNLAANTWQNNNPGNHTVANVSNGKEALAAIKEYAAANGGIDKIQIFAHSGANAIYFDQSSGSNSFYGLDGQIQSYSKPRPEAAYVSNLKPEWFNNDAEIKIWGCNAGFDGISIAKEIAMRIDKPKVKVIGSNVGMGFSGNPNGKPGDGLGDPTKIPADYKGNIYLVPEKAGKGYQVHTCECE